jgi:hypothetical protein
VIFAGIGDVIIAFPVAFNRHSQRYTAYTLYMPKKKERPYIPLAKVRGITALDLAKVSLPC